MPSVSDIGLIGLAVMGQNLARNFASRDISTVVYNRTTERMTAFIDEHGGSFLHGEQQLSDFVASLSRPRKIILMVQAGKAVDAVIEQLVPLLSKEDIIIDGGNSHFLDTIRREKLLREQEIHFLGCGVSGGEEGALHGPSLMPGGDRETVDLLLPFLKKIAAKDFSGNPCVANIGEDGAGHYVKMVHNGIEYGVMQILAEAYLLMKSSGMTNREIGDVFHQWNQGKLASFLTELSIHIVRTPDPLSSGDLLDQVLDIAGQKGTGRWTVLDAVNRGVAIPTITAAVNARIFSGEKPLREALDTAVNPDTSPQKINFKTLENAVYVAMITAYSEGFWLIDTAAKEQSWDIDSAELTRIWQGGCIIRAQVLRFLEESFREKNTSSFALFLFPKITESLRTSLPDMRDIIVFASQSGIPIPALSGAFQHVQQVTHARGSAHFIQALRDGFGAHTFRRVDREGVFHEEWEG